MNYRRRPTEISPIEFERQVRTWLERAAGNLEDFSSTHHAQVSGDSGEYEIDIEAQFQAFDGAEFKVLVECKRYKNPVKRDVVMLLDAKLRDTGAHKGIIFSTSHFQRGALEYAVTRGIALVTIQDGRTNYHTRAYGQKAEPPPWVKLSRYIGWYTTPGSDNSEEFSLIDDYRIEPLEACFKDREKA